MQPVTILLVDDDASVLQVFQHVPTDAGFEVHTVSDGRKAIHIIWAPPIRPGKG
ncbi:CheY-like chemotaxis protein [Rhizobium mongolense]|uniref:CheY-like chemotaxis protein n=1 Tax=Rhizobium mongolense TaxID=57676 RepID=A0ABR6IWU6_9HYPH|nr:CheY-like chemotaxis protein [Rhizobium mongolense]